MVKLYHNWRLIHFLMFLSSGGISMCELFLVGDEDGWNSGINFATWSQNHNFTKGDILVFNYQMKEHNVYEVNEETFRTCETDKGVLGKYDTGNDKIELKEARNYWFICNVAGHCLGGMKLGIEVNEANATIHLPLNPIQSPLPNPNHNHGSSCRSYPVWISFISIIIPFKLLFDNFFEF